MWEEPRAQPQAFAEVLVEEVRKIPRPMVVAMHQGERGRAAQRSNGA